MENKFTKEMIENYFDFEEDMSIKDFEESYLISKLKEYYYSKHLSKKKELLENELIIKTKEIYPTILDFNNYQMFKCNCQNLEDTFEMVNKIISVYSSEKYIERNKIKELPEISKSNLLKAIDFNDFENEFEKEKLYSKLGVSYFINAKKSYHIQEINENISCVHIISSGQDIKRTLLIKVKTEDIELLFSNNSIIFKKDNKIETIERRSKKLNESKNKEIVKKELINYIYDCLEEKPKCTYQKEKDYIIKIELKTTTNIKNIIEMTQGSEVISKYYEYKKVKESFLLTKKELSNATLVLFRDYSTFEKRSKVFPLLDSYLDSISYLSPDQFRINDFPDEDILADIIELNISN